MYWIKRIVCGIIGLLLIAFGITLVGKPQLLFRFVGFCIFVFGTTLSYISVKQTLPRYNFWVTLVAIGLAYSLLLSKMDFYTSEDFTNVSQSASAEKIVKKEETKKVTVRKKRKKRPLINLKEYPKISGSATVIQAHIFYISGRYVRLYGVDAPDNDQLCSNSSGGSYNCGEQATAWMSSWIDNNVIDCYILKVDPKGQDLATCMWGEYDLGAGLVGSGWGIAKTSETNIYKPYEAKAHSESSGLWQGSFYTPEDWRDIKRRQNDFTIKYKTISKGSFFNFKSWFN